MLLTMLNDNRQPFAKEAPGTAQRHCVHVLWIASQLRTSQEREDEHKAPHGAPLRCGTLRALREVSKKR